MNFTQLELPEYILKAIEKIGLENPTEIQEKTIPAILSGNDIIGQSFTGSGKTFAFGIPSIVMTDTELRNIQVLIVCPTRELTCQVCDEIRKLNEFNEGCKLVPIFGGSNITRQIQAVKKGAKIIVGTPGRLMDLIDRRVIKLHNLKMLVLDEADEMLDMGFKPDIEKILKSTNKTHQTVMFSATMPKQIIDLAQTYLKDPVHITAKDSLNDQKSISQYYINVDKKQKIEALVELYNKTTPRLSVVFCNTKKMVEDLEKQLSASGLQCVSLHGDKRQGERKKVLQSVKDGSSSVLIATDVASRGIDISNVDIVFNYDIPYTKEYYTHRIGRTARAGKRGASYTIISGKAQLNQLQEIINELGVEIIEKENSFKPKKKSRSTTTLNTTKTIGQKIIPEFKNKSKKENKKFNKTNSFKDNKSFKAEKSFKENKTFKGGKKFDKKNSVNTTNSRKPNKKESFKQNKPRNNEQPERKLYDSFLMEPLDKKSKKYLTDFTKEKSSKQKNRNKTDSKKISSKTSFQKNKKLNKNFEKTKKRIF